MLVLYAVGVFLWLVYGVWSDALPIIGANGISLILILVLLGISCVPVMFLTTPQAGHMLQKGLLAEILK